MRAKSKWTWMVIAALFVISQILFLPRMVRWIDSRADQKFADDAALETQYHDMTNAYPIASEMPRNHPTAQLWRERRSALLATGFIETCQITMKQKPGGQKLGMEFPQSIWRSLARRRMCDAISRRRDADRDCHRTPRRIARA